MYRNKRQTQLFGVLHPDFQERFIPTVFRSPCAQYGCKYGSQSNSSSVIRLWCLWRGTQSPAGEGAQIFESLKIIICKKTTKPLLRSRERQMKENHPSQQEDERSSPAAGENDYYRSNTTDETSPQRGSHRRAEICKCDGTNVRLRMECNLSNVVCF